MYKRSKTAPFHLLYTLLISSMFFTLVSSKSCCWTRREVALSESIKHCNIKKGAMAAIIPEASSSNINSGIICVHSTCNGVIHHSGTGGEAQLEHHGRSLTSACSQISYIIMVEDGKGTVRTAKSMRN